MIKMDFDGFDIFTVVGLGVVNNTEVVDDKSQFIISIIMLIGWIGVFTFKIIKMRNESKLIRLKRISEALKVTDSINDIDMGEWDKSIKQQELYDSLGDILDKNSIQLALQDYKRRKKKDKKIIEDAS